ncbi:rna-directed dna polymerase from mobile element jockey- hypothetical protein [Limosa lapponica baueri]|uniref:Rna-directed dna polymerase from mobile element jockey-like n=1 Tax=Limosa lapponica baueri TaxID=1758121 RepID=A0A2I0UMT7_LIMLA|nr:rna-directed dna polymerase from mobile element jockey- hypothetical protein [Limosa lapponica baueri]
MVDKGRASDIIYLDLCEEFDTVPHDIFVSKLKRHGFDGWITRCTRSWLNGHAQRVAVNGSMSKCGIECMLSKLAYDTKLCGAVDILEGRDARIGLRAQKANHFLGHIKRSMASWSRDVILPLLRSDETPPGVLYPAPTQEGHGLVGANPEEGHKDNQRARVPLLCKQSERLGVVQLGEEKAPGRPYSSLPVLKEGL